VAGFLYRIGRAAAAHRLVSIGVWLVLAATAVVSVRALGAETNNTLTLPGTDSQAAFDLLAAKFPPQQNGANPFVFQVERGTLDDPTYKPAMEATYRAFKASRYVYSVQNPVGKNAGTAGIISDDGRIGLMPVVLNVGGGFITTELAQKILDVTRPARAAGIDVAVGGTVGSVLSAPDTKESQLLGNVSAMVILALVFGSLVAMGLPIVNAAIGLAITTSVIGLLGHVWSVPSVASTLAVMIGLGVGIDYALFLMTKHLEQLGEGVELRESIARAVSSSGSAVVFAGGTVVIALLSLVVAGIPLVSTLGFASAIAVFMAVVTSITLLPAILSLVGHGVQKVRVPAFLQMRPRQQGQRRWDAWARWVAGHPWIAVGIALVILVPLIVPLFSLELGQPDVGVTSTSTTERQAYDMTTEGFGVGYNGPLLLGMSLDPVAEPSDAYTNKFDRATRLQKDLKREKKQLNAEKRQLERQQAQLEAQEQELRQEAAALQEQSARLEREGAALETRAEALARQIVPVAIRLRVLEARERVLKDRIRQATDPVTINRLQRRLARLQARKPVLQDRLNALRAQAETIAAQARRLEAQKADLERQAAALDSQKAQLEREGADLQAQGDELKVQADKAKRQKQTALKLKRQLTRMLTAAGGNPLGTDPRLVGIQDAVGAMSGVVAVSPPQVNDSGSAAIMNAIPKNAPSSDATANVVEVMRDDTLPPVTGDNGVTAHVGGTTATYVDLASKISSKLPLVVLTVLALSFVFLTVAFRSLLVPLQAGITNLLTVAAALGVLTAVFQWGWGLSAIGLEAPGDTVPIASYVPLMMFAVLFGLSMDYEVFLVSRIQHHHTLGEEPRAAVTSGLGAAAHVVTAAALIMFLVFASFIITSDPTIKQFGVGLATAVLLAGIMVVLLVPAMLTLFGRRLFALPRPLDRVVPHIDVEGTGATPIRIPDSSPVEPERSPAPAEVGHSLSGPESEGSTGSRTSSSDPDTK
jgi:uncharacterized membrane protein YdfJ with MMPL/SSD domain/predicted  nucleic acid-binding Zn-ribbon protein